MSQLYIVTADGFWADAPLGRNVTWSVHGYTDVRAPYVTHLTFDPVLAWPAGFAQRQAACAARLRSRTIILRGAAVWTL